MTRTFNATVTVDVESMADLEDLLLRKDYAIEITPPAGWGCPFSINIKRTGR